MGKKISVTAIAHKIADGEITLSRAVSKYTRSSVEVKQELKDLRSMLYSEVDEIEDQLDNIKKAIGDK